MPERVQPTSPGSGERRAGENTRDPALRRLAPAGDARHAGMIGLQRAAGNRAVAQALTNGGDLLVQRDSAGDYLQQAWLAARRGGVVLALSAFMLKSAASQNSVDYVGYGYHLGPGDASDTAPGPHW